MEELKDKLLEGVLQGEVSIEGEAPLAKEVPQKFISIPNDVIEVVETYLMVVFRMAEKKKNKEIDISGIINNAKYLFGPGAKWNDKYWMQHCAASLRELIIFVYPSDFHKALQCIPNYTDPRVAEDFIFLENIRKYLSYIVHFVPKNRAPILHNIYPSQRFNHVTKEELIKNEDEIFEKVCIDLVYTLYFIFDSYCISKDE